MSASMAFVKVTKVITVVTPIRSPIIRKAAFPLRRRRLLSEISCKCIALSLCPRLPVQESPFFDLHLSVLDYMTNRIGRICQATAADTVQTFQIPAGATGIADHVGSFNVKLGGSTRFAHAYGSYEHSLGRYVGHQGKLIFFIPVSKRDQFFLFHRIK